jgi:hypothetical protein
MVSQDTLFKGLQQDTPPKQLELPTIRMPKLQ